MFDTRHLGLPLIAAGQAQKHVTHNEALALVDALLQLGIISRSLAVPPLSPEEGDRYLVAASAMGDWSGHEGELAFFIDGVWRFSEFAPSSALVGEDDFMKLMLSLNAK